MKKSRTISILVSALFAFSSINAYSKDLGVQGKVWLIEERDIRERMVEGAARLDEENIKDEFRTSVDRFFNDMPRRELPTIDKGQTKFVDLSIVVKEDITAPIKENGAWTWKTIVAKGTRINPLDKVPMSGAMFFFDGGDIDQVELLNALLAKHPYTVIPIESGGRNLQNLIKQHNRQIFYASDAFIKRFQITNLPSLAYQGQGQYSPYLAVSAFPRPFDIRLVDSILQSAFPQLQKLTPKEAGNAK